MTSSPRISETRPVSAKGLQPGATDLAWIETLTRLLDTQYRIPGTRIRFGADFLLGLIPGAGDLVSMGFSGLLIATMAQKGANGRLVGRMLINVLLDTVIGSIPILGNVFDLFYKANYRNLKLMKEHYREGKHTGSVWPIVLGVVAVFSVLFIAAVFLIAFLFRMMWEFALGQ